MGLTIPWCLLTDPGARHLLEQHGVPLGPLRSPLLLGDGTGFDPIQLWLDAARGEMPDVDHRLSLARGNRFDETIRRGQAKGIGEHPEAARP